MIIEKPTVKFLSPPSHGPTPRVVFLVQEANPPQTPNIHPSSFGSQPNKAFAKELFPAPVGPTITILGTGYSVY